MTDSQSIRNSWKKAFRVCSFNKLIFSIHSNRLNGFHVSFHFTRPTTFRSEISDHGHIHKPYEHLIKSETKSIGEEQGDVCRIYYLYPYTPPSQQPKYDGYSNIRLFESRGNSKFQISIPASQFNSQMECVER